MSEETKVSCKYSDKVLEEVNGNNELIEDFFNSAMDFFDENPDYVTIRGDMEIEESKKISIIAYKADDNNLIAMTIDEMDELIQTMKDKYTKDEK